MKNHTVVIRYARALLEIGKADGQFDQYGRELKQLAESFLAAGDQAKALLSPIYPQGLRQKMLTAILDKAGLSPMVNNFVHLLMDKGRLGELADIAEAYGLLADEEKGVIQATVTSAAPLTDDEVAAIRESLNKFAGRQVHLAATVDPAIIGGLVAKLGDLTVDGSVRTQLNKLSGLLDNL